MKIEVQYFDYESNTYVPTAMVDAPDSSVEDALEYAFRWTQNIDGSWSMKLGLDGNDSVTVLAPFYRDEGGKQWGHRSSMTGDRFQIVGGALYKCASMGFKLVTA